MSSLADKFQKWVHVLHILAGLLLLPAIYLGVSNGTTTRVPASSAAIICLPLGLLVYGILRMLTFPMFPRLALALAVGALIVAVKLLWYCLSVA